MNRLLLSVLVLACFSVAPAIVSADCGCETSCCQPQTCCQPQCCTTYKTCCKTSYRTKVVCRPVTTYKKVRCRDACGCRQTKCVPCTRYVRTCVKVPVTTCQRVAQTCCTATTSCCDPCADTCCKPRRRGLLGRLCRR